MVPSRIDLVVTSGLLFTSPSGEPSLLWLDAVSRRQLHCGGGTESHISSELKMLGQVKQWHPMWDLHFHRAATFVSTSANECSN